MYKLAALLILGLALNFGWQDQDSPPPNPELERQEIVNLENEAARAIVKHVRVQVAEHVTLDGLHVYRFRMIHSPALSFFQCDSAIDRFILLSCWTY